LRTGSQFIIAIMVWMLLSCGAGAAAPTKQPLALPYRTVISGLQDFSLRDEIKSHAQLFKDHHIPIYTVAALKKRANSDLGHIMKMLNDKGYYDADLNYEIDFATMPVTLNLMIRPGKQYTLLSFVLKGTTPNNPIVNAVAFSPQNIGVVLGSPAVISDMKKIIQNLFIYLGDNGYPYAQIKTEHATVDRARKGLHISLVMDAGKLIRFGVPHYILPPGLSKEFISHRLQWKKGEVYSNTKVIETIEALNDTHLYSYVKITRPPEPSANGLAAMHIEAAPISPKGISYSLDNQGSSGVGAEVGWTKTNLFGEGDMLAVRARLAIAQKLISVEHITPDFAWVESSLKTKIQALSEDWPAYKRAGAEVSTTFSTPIVGKVMGSLGIKGSMRTVTPKNGGSEHSPLTVSAPIGVQYQSLDDPRLPRKGTSVELELSPSLQIAPYEPFFQARLKQKILVPLVADKSMVLSGWYTIGVSPGVGPQTVLALDQMFFAGGLGSVRGFGAQMVGPQTANGVPLGGLSMFAFGGEFIYYLSRDLALVGFVDAGSVLATPYPTLKERLFVSAGGGLNYRTAFGNFAVNIAFPLNKRENDAQSQVYVSLTNPT